MEAASKGIGLSRVQVAYSFVIIKISLVYLSILFSYSFGYAYGEEWILVRISSQLEFSLQTNM